MSSLRKQDLKSHSSLISLWKVLQPSRLTHISSATDPKEVQSYFSETRNSEEEHSLASTTGMVDIMSLQPWLVADQVLLSLAHGLLL